MPKYLRVLKHLFRRFVLGKPHTVRIVAAGPATRGFCPWDDKAEIWSLNRFWRAKDEKTGEPWLKRWDRWFEVHQPGVAEIENPEDGDIERHADWLMEDHDFPIYFLQEAEKYPAGVAYPISDILPEFRGMLTSSIAYMVALAIHEGFDRIELYGVEMAQGSDFFWQKPELMRILGRAEGEFIDVYAPPQSTLLRAPMYGYDDKEVAYDAWLRRELHTTKKMGHAIEKHYNTTVGGVQGVESVIHNLGELMPEVLENFDLKVMLNALLKQWRAEARKYESMANIMNGQRRHIIAELEYRDVEIGEDDMDVAGGGTDLQAAIEYAEGLKDE